MWDISRRWRHPRQAQRCCRTTSAKDDEHEHRHQHRPEPAPVRGREPRRLAALRVGQHQVADKQVPDAYAIAEPAALIDTVAELSQ